MFDILPDDAFGTPSALAENIFEAQKIAREAFKALPLSNERASILSALGRLGKWTLKKKIANRLEKFVGQVNDRFPELALVTDKAVNCRNFFVHGGEQEFDYNKYDRVLWFFVDTLEFVFAAADLTEAGWDIKKWASKGTSMTHRFGAYKFEYKADLALLKKALSEASKPSDN